MAALVTAAVSASPSMTTRILGCFLRGAQEMKTVPKQGRRQEVPVIGNFSHFGDTVRKDFHFMKKRISRGIDWANETLQLPKVLKSLDDVLWLKNLEDHQAPPLEPQSCPQPCYPELTGVDLFMADLKALEAYVSYLYYISRMWSKPLPEAYDPQDVAQYFSCRPHVVALRLLEVFSAFAFATVRIRASGIQKIIRPIEGNDTNGNIPMYKFGLVLKETMLNLGPTFIKVGQSLSTRPDIIGTEISKALSELHDQIPPFPRNMAMKIIEEELGSPVESVFTNISEEPVAAASFGQVYCAKTLDGTKVAVKVQRPNLHHVIFRDIYILRLGLGLLQKMAKRKNDLRLYADEIGKGLVGELDYTLEAANASKFLHAHSSFPFMHIPKVFDRLSRKKVLTMEWVDGESPSRLLDQSTSASSGRNSEKEKIEAEIKLLDMVSKGVEATLIQLLETGLLHADPHSGNLRYMPSRQIGFLDFGLLCQMEKKHQFAMLASIVHIVNGDWASLVRALIEMDVIRPGTNIQRVTMELEDSLGEVVFVDGIPDVKFSKVLSKIWSVALKYHFRMPPYYTLVLRSLASLEGFALAAYPNFKTFEAAYPYVVRKLLTENSTETRRILHSVVFNKRKEFRWDRLALFLNVGSTRRVLTTTFAPKNRASKGTFDIAQLMLMLSSKNGVVIRKLLMTADGASLVRAMVSKEAVFFRQQFCRVIADILYQSMVKILGLGIIATRYSSQVIMANEPNNTELGDSSSLPISMYEYQSIFKDRRMKVILSKILNSARKDPVLMLKLCWTSVVMLVMASALACHRVFMSLSEVYVGRLLLASRRVGVGA